MQWAASMHADAGAHFMLLILFYSLDLMTNELQPACSLPCFMTPPNGRLLKKSTRCENRISADGCLMSDAPLTRYISFVSYRNAEIDTVTGMLKRIEIRHIQERESSFVILINTQILMGLLIQVVYKYLTRHGGTKKKKKSFRAQ